MPVGHDTRAFESSNWGDAQREISKVLPSPSASLARSESPALARAEVGIHGRQFFLKLTLLGRCCRQGRLAAALHAPGPPTQAPNAGRPRKRPRAALAGAGRGLTSAKARGLQVRARPGFPKSGVNAPRPRHTPGRGKIVATASSPVDQHAAVSSLPVLSVLASSPARQTAIASPLTS